MLLRLVTNAAVFVFYVSCFSVFLGAFNCNWFMEGQMEIQSPYGLTEKVDLRFRMHRFPEIREWALTLHCFPDISGSCLICTLDHPRVGFSSTLYYVA